LPPRRPNAWLCWYLLFDLHLLFSRHRHFNGVPVYLDGPMGLKASKIYSTRMGRLHPVSGNRQKPAWLGKQLFHSLGLKRDDPDDEAMLVDALKEMFHPEHLPEQPRQGSFSRWRRIYSVVKFDERDSISGPCVILTGGGMCNGGPVQDYLRRHLGNPDASVLLSGYCAEGSVGHRLARLCNLSEKEVRRLDEPLGLDDSLMRMKDVKAAVQVLSGYSAHADQRGLLAWLFYKVPGEDQTASAGQRIFITHGNTTSRREFAGAIKRRARELNLDPSVELPESHRWFDLNENRWVDEELSVEDQLRAQIAKLEQRLAAG